MRSRSRPRPGDRRPARPTRSSTLRGSGSPSRVRSDRSAGGARRAAAELGLERLLLVTTPRSRRRSAGRGCLRRRAPARPGRDGARSGGAGGDEVDGLVGVGGGSAVDRKAVVSDLAAARPWGRGGAYDVRRAGVDAVLRPARQGRRRRRAGSAGGRGLRAGADAGLPVADTVGTAMNALAHCAEAYYAPAQRARRPDAVRRGDRPRCLRRCMASPARALTAARGCHAGRARARRDGPRATRSPRRSAAATPPSGPHERDLPRWLPCASTSRPSRRPWRSPGARHRGRPAESSSSPRSAASVRCVTTVCPRTTCRAGGGGRSPSRHTGQSPSRDAGRRGGDPAPVW